MFDLISSLFSPPLRIVKLEFVGLILNKSNDNADSIPEFIY